VGPEGQGEGVQAQDSDGIHVLHQSGGDAGEDSSDQIPSHRVIDDQDHVRIEEGQRIGKETVKQRVQRQCDEKADAEAKPPQGVYLTTSPGILRVCRMITSSMPLKSTLGRTAMFLKSSCPFSALTIVP